MKGIRLARSLDRFDRLVLATILALIVAIAAVALGGPQVSLKVDYFSWQGRKVGTRDRNFILTFNRPIDRAAIERDLTVTPNLPGKVSWSGDRLTYTLSELPFYGKTYEVRLPLVENPFLGQFATRDRAFAYIGVNGEERGRLIWATLVEGANQTLETRKIPLTPPDLVVTDFRSYPSAEKILFSAFDPGSIGREVPKQQLYQVTTGVNPSGSGEISRPGRLEIVIDAKQYQNLRFDLSDDGSTIVVQRVNHLNPGDASLWLIDAAGKSRPLGVQGDNFLLSPDGQKAIVSQTGGVAILPLAENGGTPIFLPTYEKGLGFSRDGRYQLLVKVDADNGRSLYLRHEQGEAKLLLRTANPILGCQLEPRREEMLYCLKSDLVPTLDGKIREEPFLSMIDRKTGQETPILGLPNYRDVQMSMAPDGSALLFDQLVTTSFGVRKDLVTGDGSVIADGRVWLLPLGDRVTPKILPRELVSGFRPRWSP
jgi:hypothetical protein